MPDIAFGPGFYERETVGVPPRELINLFPEAVPNMPDRQFILMRTPGLTTYKDLSGTITRGLGTSVDQFSNDMFVVYDNQFKRINLAGTVGSNITTTQGTSGQNVANDSLPVTMAFAPIQEMAFTSGGKVYIYDGTDLYDLYAFDNDLGNLNYVNVVYLAGRFVFIPNDDDQFWWSETLDGANIDALNFATAERKGSNLRAGTEFRGDLWLFEKDNIEIWQPTGRADLPFQLRPGGIIDKGIIGPWAHTRVGQSLFWMGEDRVVYRAEGASAVPISTPAISEHLQNINAAVVSAFSYVEDGHQFVVFNVAEPSAEVGAFVYDTTTGEWHERLSSAETTGGGGQGLVPFAVRPGYVPWNYVWWNNNHYVGNRYDAAIHRLDTDVYYEQSVDAASKFELNHVATIFAPTRQYAPCFNFTVDATRGVGNADDANPVMTLTWSDNLGRDYQTSQARTLSLGASGEYTTRATTAHLGRMTPPGRVFKIEFSDKTEFALFGARYNEENP